MTIFTGEAPVLSPLSPSKSSCGRGDRRRREERSGDFLGDLTTKGEEEKEKEEGEGEGPLVKVVPFPLFSSPSSSDSIAKAK